MKTGVWAVIAVVASSVSGTAFQSKENDVTQALPRFQDFQVPATAMFNGTPAAPQFQTPGQRMYRTIIRQATAKGPDFAGHFKVAEWGCGTACLQFAVVDSQSGYVYDGPVGIPPKGAVYLGPNVEEDKTGIFYSANSSLFIVVGCPNYTKCGSYYYNWSGTQFKLLRQISMNPLYGSDEYQFSTIKDVTCAAHGSVRIIYSDGTEFEPPKLPGQTSCSSPAVDVGKWAAGWLVGSNCCGTSYAIDTALVVYKVGQPFRTLADGMAIFEWLFLEHGEQVAFYSNTTHGDSARHYELHDVETGHLIDKWDGELTGKAPAWAHWLQ